MRREDAKQREGSREEVSDKPDQPLRIQDG
jgi:hypothetical protein